MGMAARQTCTLISLIYFILFRSGWTEHLQCTLCIRPTMPEHITSSVHCHYTHRIDHGKPDAQANSNYSGAPWVEMADRSVLVSSCSSTLIWWLRWSPWEMKCWAHVLPVLELLCDSDGSLGTSDPSLALTHPLHPPPPSLFINAHWASFLTIATTLTPSASPWMHLSSVHFALSPDSFPAVIEWLYLTVSPASLLGIELALSFVLSSAVFICFTLVL